jgi:Domain of unknown function (DUF4262)
MATINSRTQRLVAAHAERARVAAEREAAQANAEIDQLIAETGWAVCTVDAQEKLSPAPHFAYTIGRTLKGQPELCTWGHSREELAPLLNVVGTILGQQDRPITGGERLTLAGVGVWETITVPKEVLNHLVYAHERYTFLRAVRLRRVM